MSTDRERQQDWSNIQSDNPILELIRQEHLDPVQLRRIFLLLTRDVYATERNFSSEELKVDPVKWSEEKRDRTLDVQLNFTYENNVVNPKPAVYVGLGNTDFNRQAINDFSDRSTDNATTYYTKGSKVPLIFEHVSTSGDFSYLLANHTARSFSGLIPFCKRNIPPLTDMQLVQISAIQMRDKTDEKEFVTKVTFMLDAAFSWNVTLESHRLKNLGFDMAPGCGVQVPEGFSLRQK